MMNYDEAPTIPPSTPINEAATLPPSPRDTEPAAKPTNNPLPQIPGFHLESELGRGGMGVVYLARQVRLNRLVALKMIISGDHADSETKLRFLAEAEAIAKLHHPGIVQVHEFGTHDNNPYFALEYISGGSLDKKLAGNPLPPREAADLVEKLARAVQSAHDADIIHRDLKPANILLGSSLPASGEGSGVRGGVDFAPKITDFGLVKNVGSDMTATGQILGTPSYMAPEQADGKKSVGPAADIYALGAILYECLTGRAPFKAATPLDTLLQVLSDDPVSVRQLQAKTPMDLETICHKCLQKEPLKRYGSAAELAEDLGRYLRHEPIAARPVGRVEKVVRWCRRYPAVAGLVGVLMVGVITSGIMAWWAFNEKSRADSNAQQATDAARLANDANDYQVIQEGLRLADSGDTFAALPWFARPLQRNMVLSPSQSEACLRRLSNYMRYSSLFPALRHQVTAFLPDSGINADIRTVFKPASSSDKPLELLLNWDRKSQLIIQNDVYYLVKNNNYTGQSAENNQNAILYPLKHDAPLNYAAFSPDCQYLVTSSEDHTAKIWDTETGRLAFPPIRQAAPVAKALFSNDGRFVLTYTDVDGPPRVWDTAFQFHSHKERLFKDASNIRLCPDGKAAFLTNASGLLRWVNISDGTTIRQFQIEPIVRHVLIDEGRRAIGLDQVGHLEAWDKSSGTKSVFARDRLKNVDKLQHFTISQDGKYLFIIGSDGKAQLDTVTSGALSTRELKEGSKSFNDVAHASFSADGKIVVTTHRLRKVRIWNPETGALIGNPISLDADPVLANLSFDHSRMVIACQDRTARIWDVQQGIELVQPLNHDDVVLDAVFSKNGHFLLTTCKDKSARLWDATTGQPMSPPFKHSSNIVDAMLTTDNNNVITACADHSIHQWNVAPYEITKPAIFDLCELLSGYRLNTSTGKALLSEMAFDQLLQKLQPVFQSQFVFDEAGTAAWRNQRLTHFYQQQNLRGTYFHSKASQASPTTDARQKAIHQEVLTQVYSLQNENKLRQLAIAMHNYHSDFNGLPLAASLTKEGKRLLSWRVAILPYLNGQDLLHKQFKLDEPWDSTNNKALISKMPDAFRAEGVATAAAGQTHFQVFTMPFPSQKDRSNRFQPIFSINSPAKITLGQITVQDGTSDTILIAEARKAVIWTKPEDIDLDSDDSPIPPLGFLDAKDRFNVAFVDGSVRSIITTLPDAAKHTRLLKQMIGRRDGGKEAIEEMILNKKLD